MELWEFGSVTLDLVLLRGPQQWMCCPPGVVLFCHSDMVAPLACADTGEGVSGMLDVLEHEVSHHGELAHILLEIHGGEKPIDSYLNLEQNSTLHINAKCFVHGFSIH